MSAEQKNLTPDQREELIFALEEAAEDIRDAVGRIKTAARPAMSETEYYRLTHGALSHIEMALSSDHGWLGGNMFTLQNSIDELTAAGRECWDCGGEVETSEHGLACVRCGREQ